MEKLTFEELKNMMRFGGPSILSASLKLHPGSGQGGKFFPATYKDGEYATYNQRIDGKDVPCVLVDSCPSQANRMEEVLDYLHDSGEIEFPRIVVQIPETLATGETQLTTTQLPHRIGDAILRDSECDGVSFRDHEIGKDFERAVPKKAASLLKWSPTSILFGVWDSTRLSGMGSAYARCVVSEITGIHAVLNKKVSSRKDPLEMSKSIAVYEKETDDGTLDWTTEESEARLVKDKPVKFGKDTTGGKPAAINHGSIPPIISDGGFTADYLQLDSYVTLSGIRKLGFGSFEKNAAGGAYLAALGLVAIIGQYTSGYELRSRCGLVTEDSAIFTAKQNGKKGVPFEITLDEALALYKEALDNCREVGLEIAATEETPVFKSSAKLNTLLRKSMITQGFKTNG